METCKDENKIKTLSKKNKTKQNVRVQWHYNNGPQEVVTSIHFVKIKITIFQTPWIRKQTSRSFSDSDNCATGQLINPFMTEIN